MTRRRVVRGLALSGWLALVLQLYLILDVRWSMGASVVGGIVHFFSYFTVLSNTLAAGVLSAWAWPMDTWLGRWLRRPSLAACALVSIVLVGLGYNLLLSHYWAPQGAQWIANAVLHQLMPPAFIAFWWWCVPKGALRWRQLGPWALYPLGWYGFTLLRGWSVGVWPYPFLDAFELGFTQALLNALGLFGVFCLGGLGLIALDRRLGPGHAGQGLGGRCSLSNTPVAGKNGQSHLNCEHRHEQRAQPMTDTSHAPGQLPATGPTNPFNPGYFESDELRTFGFKHVGENVKVARNCTIIGLHNIALGDHIRIDGNVVLAAYSGSLTLGSYIHIGAGCYLGCGGGVTLEDFSGLSQGVKIYSGSDDYSGKTLTNPTVPEAYKQVELAPVRLGRHVIVGSGSVILPGASIGEGASVGALSLVTKPLEAWGVYFGAPAKKLKERRKDLLALEQALRLATANGQPDKNE
jgi:acetyltransferase-like isoleucine patch superfamily enzyme